MELKRNGSQPSARGPAEYFTGTVRIDPLFKAPEPSRASGAYVTFEPCARSNWHTHPLGQTLIVTSGCGFVQSWGGPIKVIRPGDVVWCPPGEKHCHGAYRHPGRAERQGRRLDGEGRGRPVQRTTGGMK